MEFYYHSILGLQYMTLTDQVIVYDLAVAPQIKYDIEKMMNMIKKQGIILVNSFNNAPCDIYKLPDNQQIITNAYYGI